MGHFVKSARDLADQGIVWLLVPLGLWILVTGMDDLFIDAMWAWQWLRRLVTGRPRVKLPSSEELARLPQKRIAVFVPLWQEHDVTEEMLAHNIAAIRYTNYDFFVGAYPNDAPTLAAVRASAKRFPHVHLALCPHEGPTSKPDCLNWVYQNMLLHEESSGTHFDVIVTHDAEDIIHPDSLDWVNYYIRDYDFVQIPVLALPTPLRCVTHGVYCDEFAEFQMRDQPVRNHMGAFVPSSGVGTAYSREAIEALAASESNRVFDPACLTEDYENGYRLHALGLRQLFVPIAGGGNAVATREYFPRDFFAAIRQRTRWVIGVVLQGWERHGWEGGFLQCYWLWRDRKGLVSNPLSLVANLLYLYGVSERIWDHATPPRFLVSILALTLVIQAVQTGVRIGCSASIYGLKFGVLAPIRAVVSNLINGAATIRALYYYVCARKRGEAMVWVKTAHAYPSREALISQRRTLDEILTGSGYVDARELAKERAIKPSDTPIGEYLVAMGLITEEDLYEALSLEQQLPLMDVEAGNVTRWVARALPVHLTAQWKVLPFRVARGRMDVACQAPPVAEMEAALRAHTALHIRFHLVTPLEYHKLEQRLNGSEPNARAATAG